MIVKDFEMFSLKTDEVIDVFFVGLKESPTSSKHLEMR